MNDRESFRAWLTGATVGAPRTTNGIPLVDFNQLDLRHAQAAPLISVLADIIETACLIPCAVPTTHATAA